VPIENYKRRADIIEKRLLSSPEISEHNKRILQRFLISYDVSDARRLIFLDKIQKILRAFPKIEDALKQRDEINTHFAELRRQYKTSTYVTYLKVSKRFLRWLNDGEDITSMRDLRTRGLKAESKRDLQPEDMVTWEEGLRMSDASCSIQLSAIMQTQLDGGFRPSEFVDLSYGDISRHTGLSVAQVRDIPGHKTGARSVVLQRCVPALFKWLDAHPTKNPQDPLWIAEKKIRSNSDGSACVEVYSYPAMRKRVRELARRCGIRKPMDFYNLRHSSCVLDKKDNLPVDLAAERHGHSVKHFVETYGRLSVDDVMQRFQSHYGLENHTVKNPAVPETCIVCKASNTPGCEHCASCGAPMNTTGAYNVLIQKQNEAAQMQTKFGQMKEELEKSHQREALFREQQLDMLRQMQEIKATFLQQRTQAGGSMIKN